MSYKYRVVILSLVISGAFLINEPAEEPVYQLLAEGTEVDCCDQEASALVYNDGPEDCLEADDEDEEADEYSDDQEAEEDEISSDLENHERDDTDACNERVDEGEKVSADQFSEQEIRDIPIQVHSAVQQDTASPLEAVPVLDLMDYIQRAVLHIKTTISAWFLK